MRAHLPKPRPRQVHPEHRLRQLANPRPQTRALRTGDRRRQDRHETPAFPQGFHRRQHMAQRHRRIVARRTGREGRVHQNHVWSRLAVQQVRDELRVMTRHRLLAGRGQQSPPPRVQLVEQHRRPGSFSHQRQRPGARRRFQHHIIGLEPRRHPNEKGEIERSGKLLQLHLPLAAAGLGRQALHQGGQLRQGCPRPRKIDLRHAPGGDLHQVMRQPPVPGTVRIAATQGGGQCVAHTAQVQHPRLDLPGQRRDKGADFCW